MCEQIITLVERVILDSETKIEHLLDYCNMVRNGNRMQTIEGLTRIRLLLSLRNCTPIQAVIDTNIVIELIKIVKEKKDEHARIEATWCLTNIATGTNLQVSSLVEKGIIPLYVSALDENNLNLLDQIIWGIGNIAGDCIEFRDMLLNAHAMKHMVTTYRKVKMSGDLKLLRSLIWAASNLCRLKPSPNITNVITGFEIFAESFIESCNSSSHSGKEMDVLIDCSWALISMITMETIDYVSQSPILPYVIKCLETTQLVLLHPCLRIVGVFSNAADHICQ